MAKAPRYVTVCTKEPDGSWKEHPRRVIGSNAMVHLLCPECKSAFYSPIHLWVSHKWELEKAKDYVREEVRNGRGQIHLTWGKTYYDGKWKIKGRMK